MIAQAPAAGLLLLAVAAGGVLAFLYLVGRHAVGRPFLTAHPRPFADIDPPALILFAIALFVGYQFAFGLLGGAVGSVVALLMAFAVDRAVLRRLLRPRGSAPRRVGSGLLVLWALLPVIYGTFLLLAALGYRGFQPQVQQLTTREKGWQSLAFFAVVVAPVLEEIIFRGLLYPAVRRMGGRFLAVGVTSVLFGIVHQPPVVWAPLTILGVVLAYLVETAGSVLPCIAAHMAFNALTVGQVLLLQALSW